ncbi:GlxA family transcriptional regulator [Neptunomonas sp.]|uniref:GlxA family transcriptional regulator n=1 Tax=Neptunomonas sp. TaxID=1971898 RepID=UPI00356252D2
MNVAQHHYPLGSFIADYKFATAPKDERSNKPRKVGFILNDHFSMLSLAAAIDALVTANLVNSNELYSHLTISKNTTPVVSDLGIEVSANLTLDQIPMKGKDALDILIICGGFRSSLNENPKLSGILRAADKQDLILGGIWNGAVHLAHAGLLNGIGCATHPDNHAFMQEYFSRVRLSANALVCEDKRITCATPASTLQMMLELIEQAQGSKLVQSIRDILSCDRVADNGELMLSQPNDNPAFPEALRHVLALMRSNLEEPLQLDELAAFVSMSRRQIERMFQTYLNITPCRYYLELRLSYAKQLLQHSNDSIINISVACGFLSTSHFSHCFKRYLGASPNIFRQQFNN